ncbi:hypothetical protein EVAR_43927_1 [Eumeta japonica]|uniref:Uncharacterized protein n=1 Tax=Eumeta variegata TaxID=151549 RepID=A0A4C1WMP3_EUMVA|nr:hypothetical protein EVAR_43927_1 [Eumeta japonica]
MTFSMFPNKPITLLFMVGARRSALHHLPGCWYAHVRVHAVPRYQLCQKKDVVIVISDCEDSVTLDSHDNEDVDSDTRAPSSESEDENVAEPRQSSYYEKN